jgi:predicted oxidoreductase (fatty acid repression mutant protein)
MKCWNSTFNSQGSRVIIIVVHVRTMKIYVTIVDTLMKKEREGEDMIKN